MDVRAWISAVGRRARFGVRRGFAPAFLAGLTALAGWPTALQVEPRAAGPATLRLQAAVLAGPEGDGAGASAGGEEIQARLQRARGGARGARSKPGAAPAFAGFGGEGFPIALSAVESIPQPVATPAAAVVEPLLAPELTASRPDGRPSGSGSFDPFGGIGGFGSGGGLGPTTPTTLTPTPEPLTPPPGPTDPTNPPVVPPDPGPLIELKPNPPQQPPVVVVVPPPEDGGRPLPPPPVVTLDPSPPAPPQTFTPPSGGGDGGVKPIVPVDLPPPPPPRGAVPEPATWAMLILGFGLAGAMVRRRRGFAA